MGFAPGLHLYLSQQRRRGLPWARARLEEQLAAGHEDPVRGAERLGEPSAQRPGADRAPLVWFHAGSEAEAMALPGLIAQLICERDDLSILVTTRVYCALKQLEVLLPAGVVHQYAPYDVPQAIDAFLTHWRPDLVVWMDRAPLPALISSIQAAGLPLVMIDGHLSDDTIQRWRWRPRMIRKLLSGFDTILAADVQTARNMRRLGAPPERVEVVGELREGSVPLPHVESERDYLAELFAARPVWLAVPVPKSEELLVFETHRQAMRRAHRLLLILVPEDPSCGPDMAAQLRQEGWTVALRSADDEPGPDVQIVIADQPGELGLWYRLAPVSLMAQTFAGHAPCDPFQPAALGSAILFGPKPGRFRDRFDRLAEAGAARRVRDAAALGDELEALLSPDTAAQMATAAWDLATAGAEVSDRTVAMILDTLDLRGI